MRAAVERGGRARRVARLFATSPTVDGAPTTRPPDWSTRPPSEAAAGRAWMQPWRMRRRTARHAGRGRARGARAKGCRPRWTAIPRWRASPATRRLRPRVRSRAPLGCGRASSWPRPRCRTRGQLSGAADRVGGNTLGALGPSRSPRTPLFKMLMTYSTPPPLHPLQTLGRPALTATPPPAVQTSLRIHTGAYELSDPRRGSHPGSRPVHTHTWGSVPDRWPRRGAARRETGFGRSGGAEQIDLSCDVRRLTHPFHTHACLHRTRAAANAPVPAWKRDGGLAGARLTHHQPMQMAFSKEIHAAARAYAEGRGATGSNRRDAECRSLIRAVMEKQTVRVL